MRIHVILPLGLLALAAACRDCEDLGAAAPNGAIDPAVFEFGPITLGSTCTAELQVTNLGGRTDLSVSGAELTGKNGNWTLKKTPTLVRIGGAESLLVDYVAEGTLGDLQSTNVQLTTDDPDNDGVLVASVTAIVTDEPAPAVKTECGEESAPVSPCANVDFGAVQVNGSGRILQVVIRNDGTADLTVSNALFNDGNGAFKVLDVRKDDDVVTFPVVIPPGRTGNCGESSGADNRMIVDLQYVPTELGADVDTLVVLSDAVNAPTVEVAVSGVGSDVGILLTPDTINFGALAEGATQDITVNVSNVGTSSASVNFACIDLENDDACDVDCTGQDDTTLGGTLKCRVNTMDGALESEGFILAATDARPGGNDERNITVTWSPIEGTTSIPATAVLALHSNILGNRVFTAPLIGGTIGLIVVDSEQACPQDRGGVCVPTTGVVDQTDSWIGSATITLTNQGEATVNITSIETQCGATIADDFTLSSISDAALAPGESGDIVVDYANNDFSTQDPCNVLVRHTGAGAVTTIPLDVIPPQ